MVAVYTGSGLGLFNTSLTQLGNAGGGRIGQGATSQYVNLATGNLVLQDLDESLLVRGLGVGLLRTYNSRGTVVGQGADGWVTGYERNLTLNGTLNAAGSTMVLVVGDGQTVTFAYSGTPNRYVSTAGDGAHDTLQWDGATSTWTLLEGSTRREELFANHADPILRGRLQRIRDLRSDGGAPAQYDVLYDGNGRVQEVRAVDGSGAMADAIVFGYNIAGQLATVQTRENGVLKSQVSYGYEFADGSGRLAWVQTDLTPQIAGDNTWNAGSPQSNDGRLFRTSYTYVSATASDLRIASVTTGDGVTVSYTYEGDGVGGFRVKTVMLGGGPDAPQQVTTFVYNKNSTDVIDGNGRTWTYEYDADRQLTGVLDPAINGLRRKTEYRYDGSGNLIRMLESPFSGAAPGLDTTYQYDANGNRTQQQDRLGNTIAWTYNAANQVDSEIRYTVPAVVPLGKGMYVPPSGELTKRYVYDGRNRLRFEIDAAGAVRELIYAASGNGVGQVESERRYLGATYSGVYDEASLNAWATNATAARRANSALTAYSYDAKGRLAQIVTYAAVTADANGAGVLDAATEIVNHVYDAQGLLRQKIVVHGSGRTIGGAPPATSEVVDYVYDGMGRLLSVLSRNASTSAMPDPRTDPAGHAAWLAANDASTLLTTYAYADAGRQVWTTFDSGMIRLDQYNRTGQLGITTEFGAENRYTYRYYDAAGLLRGSRAANGGMSYFFYDDAGRLTGTVDETGAVVQTRYNDIGQAVEVVAYATRVDTTDWLSLVKGAPTSVVKDRLVFSTAAPALGAGDVWVRIDGANDRRLTHGYDGAGRLATETDAAGLVTTYAYDGASRLVSTTVEKPGDPTVVPRRTRLFHDVAGRLLAALDAAGYLVETVYDAAGRAVKTVRYATITNAAFRESGTLDQLRPAGAAGDQVARLFYNARNQQIGMLDAEGYLTEFIYDEANNQRAVKGYAKRLANLNGSENFASLRTAAMTNPPIEPFRLTQRGYNALGQLAIEQNHEGTVTRFTYDDAGRLVKTATTDAVGEVREGNRRYDVFGNLIGELGGEGSTHLSPGMTEPEIDAAYAQYGMRHSYDPAGRRIESIDAAGNKTWYFYDDAGRQTFVVRGVHDVNGIQNAQGEVVETRYNAFGDIVDSIAYTGRITLATAGNRDSAKQAISVLAIGSADSRVRLGYDTRGLLAERTDAEGYRTSFTYTAFGELRTQQDLEADGSVRRTVTNSYDNRGLLTGQTETGGVLSRSTSAIHDAFGRVFNRTDARGNTVTIGYDRLGRVVSQTANNVSGRNETVGMEYDAFGRTVTTTDELGRVTQYVHNDNARSVTVITPEGVSITTAHNGFGQTLTVSRAMPDGTVATTTTSYNKDGQLHDVTDPFGRRVELREYDARGLLVAAVDGSDRRVEYRYDAAGRVLKRIEDPNGLALTTTTTYDGQGRALSIVDASGRETRMLYDRKGNLTETILSPNAQFLRTTYTWDRDGRQLTVTEGFATSHARTISYGYDNFGRRVTETIAPGTLDLVTTYEYDANDNVVRRTDASGRVTRFAYDAANRLRFSVDDVGGITEYAYDAAGREKMVRSHAAMANLAGLSSAPSEAEVSALIDNQSLRNDAKDETRYSIHDRDGRVVMTVDGAGGVVAYGYDIAGRNVTERRHTQKATLTATLRENLRAGTATVADVGAVAGIKDMQVRRVYDAIGQVAFTVDAFGAVERTYHDEAGRVVARVRHAITVNPATIGNATTVAQVAAAITESAADQIEYFVHDEAGRLRYTLTGSGTLSQTHYDGAGRVSSTRLFSVPMAVTATLRAKLLEGSAKDADFTAFVDANEATARAEYRIYDLAGRVRFTVVRADGGQGVVSEVRYDTASRVTTRLQYGVTIPFDPTDTLGELSAQLFWMEARTTSYVYDSAGRQRFVIDASGSLTETRYDGAGRITDTIAYEQRPPASTVALAGLSAWASGQSADDVRRTQSSYDAAGRLRMSTDALNKTEVFEYDAIGRLTTRIDRNNAVWTYQYDAAGNVSAEFSPQVMVASADSQIPQLRSIVTRYTYDGNGNLLSRTENADAQNISERRTTDYEYDSRGHQTRVTFADPGVVDPNGGAIVATGVRPTIEVVFDALGQAVMQKDVRGRYSYKTYDALGRLTHEIDQERQVTSYTYNVYGERTQVLRHANVLGSIPGWSQGQPISHAQMLASGLPAASADDRTITTEYDLRGQKRKVELSTILYYGNNGASASGKPTTLFTYNAYGDLTTESVLLEGVSGSGNEIWATTYRYYDALGRNDLTVNALGYVTATRFAATGEAEETIEYARALTQIPDAAVRPGLPAPGDAAVGDDRITRWTYDLLGRKQSETSVRRYARPDGSTGTRDVVATYGYDGEGRVTTIVDETGTTSTTYDAMGRMTSVMEPTRAVVVQGMDVVLGGSAATGLTTSYLYEQRSPYTTMVYDAFGNAVSTRRYANGKNGDNAADPDDDRDQVQRVRYDWQGRAVWEQDGEGAIVTRNFDAADNLTGIRYALTGTGGRTAIVRVTNTYDDAGRQETTLVERDQYLNGAFQNTAVDSGETVTYNAFGEITGKTMHGLSGAFVYHYDAAGRLTGNNEKGSLRSFGYNLAGHQVRTLQKAYLSGTTADAITLTRVDKIGRTIEIKLPSHTSDMQETSTVRQTIDRWGNVTRIVDARGYQTDYEYNSLNQLVREIRPLAKVVAENGGVSWIRPVNHRYYDALGRLVATRDANGNLRTNEYDAVGRMVQSKDAYGNATRYAYDALGNQRAMQNPLGYLTFKEYDRMGRVAGIGDYLPAGNGAIREKAYLQRYALNQNGDRIGVTTALGTARYDYDSRNQLIRSQTVMGVVMEYAYDAAARRIRESNALSLAASAPTYLDADGEAVRLDELTWDYDVFGRAIDHNNLSGRDSDYTYDAQSGQLVRETGAGGQGVTNVLGDRVVSYYLNGRIRQVVEGGTTYRYEYDASGNKTLEEVTTSDAYGQSVRTITRTTYDSQNRVERVVQDDVLANKRVFDLLTEYDANGNRRHVRAMSGYGPNVDGIPVVNAPPVVVRDVDPRTVRKGIDAQFRLLFTDIFRDPEQNALSLTISEGDGTPLPAWLQAAHDPVTGEIVFSANPPDNLPDQDIVVRLAARETANPSNTVETSFVVRVRANTPPEPIAFGDISLRIKTGQPWNMDLVASDYFRDADVGDSLSLSIDTALPWWVQVDNDTPGVIRLSGIPQETGTFVLRLRATDELGASAIKQFIITPAPNAAPQVVNPPSPVDAIISRQFEWSRDLSEVFTDQDGDRMQVAATLVGGGALPAWLSFQYLYDQGTPQIVFAGNVPTDELNGRVYNIALTATDVDGASVSTTLAVRVFANRAPAPTAGTFALSLRQLDNFNRAIPFSALFNDPESDALAFATLFPQGSPLSSWLKMTVDHAARTVTFSKHPNTTPVVGSFSFDLRATDIGGLTGTKTFSVTVGADTAPVWTGVPLADHTLSTNRTFTYTLPDGLFSDPDGDPLTLAAFVVVQESEPAPGGTTLWSVNTQPLPDWMTFNAATRTFSGLVPSNQTQRIILRVRASDGRLMSAANEQFVGAANDSNDRDIHINFQPWTNRPPVYTAGSLPARGGIEGQPVDFLLPANAFSEPDGDTLSYAAKVQIGANLVDISAIGLSIDPVTGRIGGTLANLTQNVYTVSIEARDPQGLMVSGTFQLSVSRKPIAPVSLSHQVMVNQPFSYPVPGFSDPEGGTLTFTARMANGASLPAWMSMSTAGVLSGTGTTLGIYPIVITATDPSGLSSSTTLQLAVINNPPVYTPGSLVNQVAQPSQAFSYTVPTNAFTDPNGDPLTFSADWNNGPLPSWLSFNAATRTFSGTPMASGNWAIRLVASDGSGTASATFTITTPNVGPVYSGTLPTRTAPLSSTVSWPMPAGAFTDANGDALSYSLEVLQPAYTYIDYTNPAEPVPVEVDAMWVFASVVGLSIASNGTISGTIRALVSPGNGTSIHQLVTQTNYNYDMRIVARDPANVPAYGVFEAIANIAPTAPSPAIGQQFIAHNAPGSVVLPAFVDANMQTLTYSVSNLPPGLSFNAATRTISGTAPTRGDWVVTYTAADPLGASATVTFTLTVGTDTPPVRTGVALPDRAIGIGRTFSYTLPDGLFVDNDGDGFSLIASRIEQRVESEPGSPTTYWVGYLDLPTWMTFNAATRTFSGTVPSNHPVENILVRVKAVDTRGRYSEANENYVGAAGINGDGDIVFSVQTMANAAPVYNPGTLPNRTLSNGIAVNFPLPAGAFTEPDGQTMTYSAQVLIGSTWTNLTALGLGINASTGLISGTAANVTHSSYLARIYARDPQGLEAFGEFTFGTTNTAPVATPIGNRSVGRNEPFNLALSAFFTDANNDPLTYSASGLPSGITLNASSGQISGSTNQALGNYPVTVTANDGRGGVASTSFTLSVVNSAPVSPAIPNQTAPAGQFWSYIVPAFTDPNGDTLTYSASGLPAWMSFNATTRVLSGTPNAVGSWNVTITATDTSGVPAARTFTVATPSTPPVYNGGLTNQAASPGVPFTYTVPAGAFTDADGQTLAYSADANGVALPGWLGFNPATRTFTGTPSSAGTWTIRVMASDGTSTASGTFSISTANVGPVLNGVLPPRTAPVNTAVSWSLPAGAFTDPNGDALNYTLEVQRPGYLEAYYIPQDNSWDFRWIEPAWVAASSVGLSIAASGTISGTIQGLYTRGDDRVVNNQVQQVHETRYDYSLRITARDPANLAASGVFAASANVAPVAPVIATQTARQSSPYSFTLPAFTDANANALTYAVGNLPPGLSFSVATRTISGTPGTAGSWTVSYAANDGNGGVATTNFIINVTANTQPVAPSVPAQTGTVGVNLSLPLPAFTDADFDTLTYSIAGLPSGLVFDANTRVVSGTPTTAGVSIVTYTANDGRGGTAGVSFNFTIGTTTPGNRPPELTVPLDDQLATTGEPFEYTFQINTFTDPDNHPLTYTATQASGSALPTWLNFNADTRTFWGTPTGAGNAQWTIRVRANDGHGGQAHDDFILRKENSNLIINGAEGDADATANLGPDSGATAGTDGNIYSFDMGAGLAVDDGKGLDSTDPAKGGDAEILPILPVVDALAKSVPVHIKDEWFVYDAENRLKLVGGRLIGDAGAAGTYIGLGASGAESYELMYDAAGRAVGRFVKHGENEIVYRTTYDLRGRKQYEFHAEYLNPVDFEFGGISRAYRYDAADQLLETRDYYSEGSYIYGPVIPGEPRERRSVAGWLSGAEIFHYDADGRMTVQVSRARAGGLQGIQWPASGNFDDLAERTDISRLDARNWVQYTDRNGNSGYDALGRVNVYRYWENSMGAFFHTFVSTYEGWGTYQEKTVAGSNDNTNYKPTTNTLTYDAFGRLSTQREHTEYQEQGQTIDDRVRVYTYNGDGRVLTRRDGTIRDGAFDQTPDNTGAKDNYLFVHAAGQQQAELREGGQIRNSHYTYNTPQIQTLNGRGNYAAGGGTVVALQGETLQTLAQRVYGNSSLWYVLADANGLSNPDGQLVAGTQLNTPRVNVNSNDAGTFKPYNPAETIGPTTPGLPFITPPPKQSCSALATILIVIVAVVVTVYTAGAAASAFGATGTVGAGTATAGAAAGTVGAAATGATITGAVTTGVVASTGVGAIGTAALAGGALAGSIGAVGIAGAAFIGGVAGSIASQLVGKALGVVESFSLRSAVASGFSSVLTAGISGSGAIGKLAGNGKYANVASGALNGAAGTITSYAANRLAGLDSGFSWRSIAASAVSGAITAGLTPDFDQNATGWRGLRNEIIGGSISRVIGLHTRRAFGFDDRIDYGGMLADAFGNALGNATLKRLARYETERELLSGLTPDQRAVASKALKNGASPEEAMEVLKAMGMGLDSPQIYAYGEGPPAEQLILETVEAPEAFDPYQMWRDDFAALRTGSGLINGKGYDLGAVHNDLVDYGIALVDLFESFSLGSDNPILMESVEAAVLDRDANNAILRAARLDPYDLQGLSAERMRSEVLGGIAGSIQKTYALAQVTKLVVSQPMAFMRLGGLYNFLGTMAEGGESLGRTTLAANLASAVPLVGLAVSSAQMYALDADIYDLNIMAEIGLISPSAHRRAINDARYEQAETGVSMGLGGVPGKVGKVLQTLFFAATSSDAEAGQASGRLGRSIAAAGRGGASLVRRFADDLKGTHLSSTKYGNIPAEHRWRYDRYLQESKRSVKLSPELWYKKAQIAWANNAGGNVFERQVREAYHSPMGKGSKPVAIDGHIPDLPVGQKFGVTDVKNVEYLTSSSQLNAFYKYARANNLKFNLVVGPRTNAISAPLLDQVRNTGGRVTLFNPSTGKFSRIAIPASGPWSR